MTLRKLNGEETVEINDVLDEINGGHNPCTCGSTYEDICPVAGKNHNKIDFIKTGRKFAGEIFGTLWPDVEYACPYCGKTKVLNF